MRVCAVAHSEKPAAYAVAKKRSCRILISFLRFFKFCKHKIKFNDKVIKNCITSNLVLKFSQLFDVKVTDDFR